MPALRIHTHCQVAQKSNHTTKIYQRVYLPKPFAAARWYRVVFRNL